MSRDVRESPRFYSDFYRDHFYGLLRLIVFEVIVILGLLLAITYCIFSQPHSKFSVTTTSGLVLPITGK